MKKCVWIKNDDGTFDTACAGMQVNNGGKYCPFCGKEIEISKNEMENK